MQYIFTVILLIITSVLFVKRREVILITTISLYLSSILLFPGTTAQLSQILLILFVLRTLFENNLLQIRELYYVEKFLVLFLVVIFFVMIIRGTGIQFLGF